MSSVSSDVVLSALHWRYAVKKFDANKKLSASQWAALEEVLILSPSSYGLQPWRFIVVTDPAVRKQLTAASWGQSQIEDCSHLVVFAAKAGMKAEDVDQYIASIAATRGVTAESLAQYRGMMVGSLTTQSVEATTTWAAKQCYIALGNLLTSAALMGIDACPMEGIEPAKYNQILGLDKQGEFTVTMVAAVGFRSNEDGYAQAKKVRFPASVVVKHI